MTKALLIIAAALMLSACASTDNDQPLDAETEKWLNDPDFIDDDGSGK